jgi:lipopolysaccharide/colanic/teichoic acid biosynthesis glycosyltransferase
MRVLIQLFTILLIIILSPLYAVIAISVYLDSGLPILFRQKRIGKNGKPFIMYKFRTMGHGAEKQQKELTPLNEAYGPVFKMYNDPRYTAIGKFLAHTGLDELPQLYNILRGDMALIGPRPLPVAEGAKLLPWQRKRHEIKPGIISPWILEGYHAQAFDAWMKSDIAYAKRKNFGYDVHLAARTVALLLRLFFREFTSHS